jgi:hypothetical protein
MAVFLNGGPAERRTLEFKPPFGWRAKDDLWVREKVTRAILGMTNTPTGGVIVVGVDAETGSPVLRGLTDEQISSFEEVEAIKSYVDGFATSATNFDITIGKWAGSSYMVIRVYLRPARVSADFLPVQ